MMTAEFDLLIIGGGVTGAGAALDAATRGLKVALIEAQDFASGTSSRSSKLIHGGLRYLEQYDFALVREALHERELMVSRISPHLVKAVSFLFPLHERIKERGYIGAGLALYDALRGRQKVLPNHRHLTVRKMREIAPGLRSDILVGGFLYYDAQVDDARHTYMLARTAEHHGALIANRVTATELLIEKSRVVGVQARDLISGKSGEIRANVVVLAAGVWNSELQDKAGIPHGYEIAMSKGVHITIPKSKINLSTGVILKTEVSVLFIIPWDQVWIVGTTDTPWNGSKEEPLATSEDVNYILAQANKVLVKPLKRSDVVSVYAGIRPLVAAAKVGATTKLSREHLVDSPMPGLVSVAGGKYTTYRVMAADVIDAASQHLLHVVPESCTSGIALVGADGYQALINRAQDLADEYGVMIEDIIHLLNRYGNLISEVLEPLILDESWKERLLDSLPYLRAEIRYAVSHERALTIADVLMRRTRIALESADRGRAAAPVVAEIMARVLMWDDARREEEIASYLSEIDRAIAAETELVQTGIQGPSSR